MPAAHIPTRDTFRMPTFKYYKIIFKSFLLKNKKYYIILNKL